MEFARAHSQGTNSIQKMNTKFIRPSGHRAEKGAPHTRGANKARTEMTILLFHASRICVPREVIFMWRHVLTVYSDRFRLSINGTIIFGRPAEICYLYILFSSGGLHIAARFNVTNTLLGGIGLMPSSEMRRRVVAFFYSFIIFITTTTSPESFEPPAQWMRRGLFLLTTKTALLYCCWASKKNART